MSDEIGPATPSTSSPTNSSSQKTLLSFFEKGDINDDKNDDKNDDDVPVNAELPFIVYDSNDCYKATRAIGVTNKGVIVYETIFIPYDSSIFERGSLNDVFVAIQVVHESDQQLQDNLLIDTLRSRTCVHKNILAMKRRFVYKKNLVAVMPLNEMTSLRNVMRKNERFNQGLPEELIAVAIRETIYGVFEIHKKKTLHEKIGAGNVFVHLDSNTIKIAYGASMYDSFDDLAANDAEASNFGTLNLSCVFEWGAAPEVFKAGHHWESHSVKSDVWLVGILALELAYGRLFRISSRRELERLVEEIRASCHLPDKEEKFRFDERSGINVMRFVRENMPQIKFRIPWKKRVDESFRVEEYDEEKEQKKKGKTVMDYIKRKVSVVVAGKGKKKEKAFSTSFEKMVVACLAGDPFKRPTMVELLKHKFFKNSRTLTYFMENVMLKDEFVTNWIAEGR